MSKLAKNISIYTVVSVLQKSTGFILIPIYTHYLSKNDYGLFSILNSTFVLLSIVLLVGTTDAIVRIYHSTEYDEDYIKRYWGNAIFLVIIIAFVFISINLGVFRKVESLSIFKGISFFPQLLIIYISGFFHLFIDLYQATLIAKESGKIIAIINLGYYFTNVVLIIISTVVLKAGLFGILVSLLITNIAWGLCSFFFILREVRFSISRSVLKNIIGYSLPLVPHSLAGILMSTIDRYFLNSFLDASYTGIYNLSFQFANILLVFISSFNKAYAPWFYRNYNSSSFGNIKRISVVITLVICYLAFIITIFTKEAFLILVDNNYNEALLYTPFLIFTVCLNVFYYLFIHVLYMNNTRMVPLITLTAATANIILNYYLIPRYGITGAILASFISNFIRVITAVIVSNRYKKFLNFFNLFAIYWFTVIFSYVLIKYFSDYFFIRLGFFIVSFALLLLYVRKYGIRLRTITR